MSAHVPVQAPAGGAVSPLNGEFYAGGQFMACQFDMPKGYARKLGKLLRQLETHSINLASVRVTPCRVMIRYAGSSKEQEVFSGGHEQCKAYAGELLAKRQEWYLRQGLSIHPTELVHA